MNEKLNFTKEPQAQLSSRDLESQSEKAKLELSKTAKTTKNNNNKINKLNKESSRLRYSQLSKKRRNESYAKIIKQVQNELPRTSRTFSKILHNKTIEPISNILAETIARPNAILTGSIVAFIITLLTYTVSKIIGYNLSGSETIYSFILGWLIGLTYDYLRLLFSGKKY